MSGRHGQGEWIAAEIAVMASHRLHSLVLIDPVGIKVEGWIYPFLFAMELPELVATLFHRPEVALALAPRDQSIDTLVELYRTNTPASERRPVASRHEQQRR